MDASKAREFVLAHTRLATPPLAPEIRLHLADEPFVLWKLTLEESGEGERPPPFWAFPWAGGQALARYVLDTPEIVRGRRALDLASGSGLVAIAAVLAGAAAVTAAEIDPFALAAIALNTERNSVTVTTLCRDILDADDDDVDVDIVLAGDVFYEQAMAERVRPFLERARRSGAVVLVGDPDREYFPRKGFTRLETYDVPVSRALEGVTTKKTRVWGLQECG